MWSTPDDIVWRDPQALVLIAAKQWPGTPGHALIVPVVHHEHLYALPDALGAHIHSLARRTALAMKSAYGCEGVSTRQHNEPAGQQDVWHYHLHVFPRWADDQLYVTHGARMAAQERATYAQRLRAHFQ